MSDWPEYHLLPPPPPTWLSTKSPQRAELPRFQTVSDAVDFAMGQVAARDVAVKRVSLYVVIIYIGLLTLLAICIIIRRLWTRNFWLFRVIRRADGVLLVPHLHNCWSFMAGSFAFVSTIINVVSLYYGYQGWPKRHNCVSLLFMWTPLYLGSSWMGWAAAVAGTQDLMIRIRLSERWRWSIMIPPWVANTIGLGLPASCAVAILYPVLRADTFGERARVQYLHWYPTYAHTETFSEPMLVELQEIWFNAITSSYWVAIAAMLWSMFAGIHLVGYFFFSQRLIRMLYRHLHKTQGKSLPLQNALSMSMGIIADDELSKDDENYFRPKARMQPPHEPEPAPQPESPMPKTILPSLSSRQMPPTAARLKYTGSGSVGRAVLYFAIQAGSVTLGMSAMVAVAIITAVLAVPQAELGHLERQLNLTWLLLSYVCIVFGTTTLCSIAHETFEESIAFLVHPSNSQTASTSGSKRASSSRPKAKGVTISLLERRRRLPHMTDLDTNLGTRYDEIAEEGEVTRPDPPTPDRPPPSIDTNLESCSCGASDKHQARESKDNDLRA